MIHLLLFLICAVNAGQKLTPEEREAFNIADKAIFHLTSFNYEEMIKTGTWAVFYGLRACTHCSRFTPVWRQLEVNQPQVYKPIRLAKVECMKMEDRSVLPLCDFVNGFPSIYLHHDGKFQEEMMGDLNYNLTLEWLKSMREKYHPQTITGPPVIFGNGTTVVNSTDGSSGNSLNDGSKKDVVYSGMDKLQEILDKEREPSPDINPDGKIVHLTDDDFDELAPTWEELASEVKGYINIGKVDATKETKLQERFGIDRFPMLKFLRLPDVEPISYTGDRSLKELSQAVMKFVSAPFFTPVKSLEINSLKRENEVALFLIFDPISMDKKVLRNFEIAVRPWVGTLKIFVTPDVNSTSALSLTNAVKFPALVVSKEYGLYMQSYNGSFHNVSSLASWVKSVKDPLLLQLDSSNQAEIFNGKSLVVLALVDPDVNKTNWSPALESTVKTWKSLKRPVIFVWLDAILHSGYVERVYSIKSTELPRLVIADPQNSDFYNVDADGNPFKFDETHIATYINDVIDGKLTPKSTSGILGTVARKVINSGRFVTGVLFNNPILLVIILLLIGYVLYTCIRIGLSDYTSVPDSKSD